MPVSTEKLFAKALQRPLSLPHVQSRRPQNVRQKPSLAWRFTAPHVNNEFLYRQDRQTEALKALKTTLLLGAICFLPLIVLGLTHGGLSDNAIIGCLSIAQTLIALLPVYFFTYGQMFMTLTESLTFGMLAMIVLPLSGSESALKRQH